MGRSKKYRNYKPKETKAQEHTEKVREFINPVSVQRVKQDIGRWRRALREAESITSPTRYQMQQMYLDTVLNGQVAACLERRTMNVLKKGIEVCSEDGVINEGLTKVYNQKFMYDILKWTLDAKYYGYSLIQLGDMRNYKFDELYTIRRSNINPDFEVVTADAYSENGISFYDPEYTDNLIYVNTNNDIGMAHDWGKCGYGILYKIAAYEIWYKQAITLWSEYQQLFGMPIRIGKTDTKNEQMRNQMSQMMENMGGAAWGVFDTDDSIELIASMSVAGGNDVYKDMLVYVEKMISKIILGHADALDSVPGKLGSSQGDQSPTFLAMKDIESFDCKFLESELEDNILPKLYNLGFPKIPQGQKLQFSNNYEKNEERVKEDLTNKATADMVKVLFESGFDVDAKWVTERTGIPLMKKEVIEPVMASKNILRREELKNQLDKLYAEGCDHTHE